MTTQSKKEVTSTLIILALFPIISATTGAHLAETEQVPFQEAFFEAAGVIPHPPNSTSERSNSLNSTFLLRGPEDVWKGSAVYYR